VRWRRHEISEVSGRLALGDEVFPSRLPILMTSASRDARELAVTEQVVASFDGAQSARYREVMQSLVRHLHDFVRDVRLTDEEWHEAIGFLTRTGHMCNDRRQEFVLLSDVLGLSMLTVAVNEVADSAATQSTVFGPFFVENSPEIALGGDLAAGAVGQQCWVEGTVRGVGGEPVVGARIDVWEADGDGLYDVQYDGARTANRGHLFTDIEGGFRFWSVRPVAYPIPTDGPVGRLLAAAGRGGMRPAHIHFLIRAAGYHRLTTHVFVAGDEYLAHDAVFGVKERLVTELADHPSTEPPPPGGPAGSDWSSVSFDFVLARVHSRVAGEHTSKDEERPMSDHDKKDLEAEAKAHIDEMPAETALGNADPEGGGKGTPEEFVEEHEGRGGK
jgi:hydroxyquinol 1,2-dioxygenase